MASEQEKAKFPWFTFWLIIGILVMLGLIAIYSQDHIRSATGDSIVKESLKYDKMGLAGHYSRGRVQIKTALTPSLQDYLYVAVHEYGHVIMDKSMTVDDLKKWSAAVHKCGLQSDYARSYKSRSVRYSEEWADNYAANYMNNITLCPEKLEVMMKYAAGHHKE
jgi:hypothetical protein